MGPKLRRALWVPALASLAACAINPVTGERELALISEDQEIAMGREAAQQVETSLGYVDDAELQQYVANIGTELARDSERPELPWEFHVVDDPVPNAFALPGGYIFITRGLVSLMNSEAELAAVLGHEIGHVTARHSVNQLSRAQLAQLGLGLGMIVAPELQQLGNLANAGLGLLFLKYGRDDERQADSLGFRYMLDDGYDVHEMEDVFAALQASGKLAGQSPVPSWLASHPSEPDRIAAVRERIDNLESTPPDLKVNASPYLSRVNGLTYGSDPRHGYFDDGMFYHPELAFQFIVPDDWQKQNLTSAVAAVSPERDAALQLTLARGDASAAAAQFFGQDGVAEIESQREDINGRNAIISTFQAPAEGGVVRGTVAHIESGEATYRLITYAPEGAYGARRALFAEIVGSFAPVTDPDVLGVQPRKIEVVKLDRAMTLGEFAERYPSVIPVDELAVINQVEGSDSRLDANAEVKRVVS
jgi:predicted Zn-dependent protease